MKSQVAVAAVVLNRVSSASFPNTISGVILPATATVASGATLPLTATLVPFGVKGAITWASATTSKATVDSNGVVTGKAAGTTVITASITVGETTVTDTCTVTVTGE